MARQGREGEAMTPTTQQYEQFGRLVWDWCRDTANIDETWQEDIMPMAGQCRLAEYVEYDPKIHGDLDDGIGETGEPGDMIWYWGKGAKDNG